MMEIDPNCHKFYFDHKDHFRGSVSKTASLYATHLDGRGGGRGGHPFPGSLLVFFGTSIFVLFEIFIQYNVI